MKEIYDLDEKAESMIFKKVDLMRLIVAVGKVNNVLRIKIFLKHLILLKQTILVLLALSSFPDN